MSATSMNATSIPTMNLRFAGKTALITGGSHGIGLATAKQLAADGAQIAITGTDPEELAAALRELPQGTLAINAVAGIPRDTAATMAHVREAYGQLDILFINETVAIPAASEAKNNTYLEQIFDVNFKGTFFTIQQALPLMDRGASVIINTSWLNASNWQDEVHMPARWILTAAKAAVRSYANAELTPRGIRLNAVNSDPASTSDAQDTAPTGELWHEMADRLQDQMPLATHATWDQIVDAVVFLASDESSYMLGSELTIDGAMSHI
ncbi:SDR family oxidoreductase [Granulicella sp. dw_53]|uniref:SDR family oxidoreductase n=1 Tax=Granulicella sp. dw_53 TaxID=2719792 RepID=UPI001BD21861|nr:SDR family oxidoreductase [Granulicella sp. dw_53]